MTNEEIIKEATKRYFPGSIILSAYSGAKFILEEHFYFDFDSDGDLRAEHSSEKPVLYDKSENKWAEIISPHPIEILTNNFPIY